MVVEHEDWIRFAIHFKLYFQQQRWPAGQVIGRGKLFCINHLHISAYQIAHIDPAAVRTFEQQRLIVQSPKQGVGGKILQYTDMFHFLETDHSSIVDILKNAEQPIIGVCISDQIERLTAGAEIKKPVQPERQSAGRATAARNSRAS